MIITTPRLTLTKWSGSSANLNAMVVWLNDPDVVRYSEQRHKHHTPESQQHYLEDGPDVFREIHAGDHFIGTITAYIDEPNSVADVGILIGEKAEWGKGYGTEAWTAFCDTLFKNKIRKIEAGCIVSNYGMSSICRKYKMNPEGYRTKHFLLDGYPLDMMMYGKFA